MFVYYQAEGTLYDGPTLDVVGEGYSYIGEGYSGFGVGKNNPLMQSVPDVGPIPHGDYLPGVPFDSPKHGPLAIPLTPLSTNNMFGREGFLMHGDSIEHPGEASKGCIIMPRSVREQVAAWGGKQIVRVV